MPSTPTRPHPASAEGAAALVAATGAALRRLAAASPALVGLFLAMLLLVLVAAAGLVLDPRVITGAPAWEKPLKFALSVGIYALAYAWLLEHVQGRPRLVRGLEGVTFATLAVEMVLIPLQAARGTTSHFNLSTPFDYLVFRVMGGAIFVLFVAQVLTSLALLRQRFADPVLAATLRAGMVLTTLGAAVGGLMLTPRGYQIAQMAHGMPSIVGSHSIGGLDGGPGIPFVHWNRDIGDLRVAHFFGLHALQLLPLVAWLVSRPALGLSVGKRLGLVRVAAASSFGLMALLVWQALRGQAVIAPDAATWTALALWLAATVGGSVVALVSPGLLARDGQGAMSPASSGSGSSRRSATVPQ